uniref:No apical meristem-associated C-terminal domain-containing protein n=1 Tax=Lactuca sativa TaxID=4236 RepID=A0A9R1V7N1_LACSA|nr:hypothetical protein LSAT_V11C600333600 [Lactuca sativa]
MERVTEGSSQSSDSKRARNSNATSQQSDRRTHFDINDDPFDLEDEKPLRRSVGRNKVKKSASTASGSSVMNQFGEKFDNYVHVQETKAEILIRVEQKLKETPSMIQTKTYMEILQMKADDLKGEYFELFLAMKESIRVRCKNRG